MNHSLRVCGPFGSVKSSLTDNRFCTVIFLIESNLRHESRQSYPQRKEGKTDCFVEGSPTTNHQFSIFFTGKNGAGTV